MSDEAAIRRANLRSLKKTPKELQAVGGGAYSYWRDLMEDPKKSFGEKAARSIEEKLELPRGWLDTPHGDETTRPLIAVQATPPAPDLAQALPVVLTAIANLSPMQWSMVRGALDQLHTHPEMHGDAVDQLLPSLQAAATAAAAPEARVANATRR